MCITAKACNYKHLRPFKSRPEESAVDLKVRELKVNSYRELETYGVYR
jgi:hypothetical protein